MLRRLLIVPAMLVAGSMVVALTGRPAAPQQPQQKPPQQGAEVSLIISGAGTATHFAVPDFIAPGGDADTVAAAKTIGQVLWDDLNFEREFDMIPRDVYGSIPAARSGTDVPFDRWREVGADGLVIGTVQKTATGMRVDVRLYQVQTGRIAFSKQYEQAVQRGRDVNLRLFAHTISDEIFQHQRGLRGVARTRLAFDSNRDAERVGGTIEQRQAKEIYISDYDGANQQRVTTNRSLNITPNWSPDGRAIAYTSYVRGTPDIFIAFIFQGLPQQQPAHGRGQNFLPVYSPDGTHIVFMSTRDGNPEIYVMSVDGSNVVRLTNNPANDVTPTWSPSGTQIAFVSDRSGSPQIYVVNASDGLNLTRLTSESYCDRPTWSPAPFNEVAYASRTSPGGFDIKVLDLATSQVRQVTFGQGTNESPAYSANGRHIAFMSTRGGGRQQIFTIGRDGRDLRQITKAGANFMPNWSR
jgi:TolB protein